MFDYEVSRLEDFTLDSINDLLAIMSRCCAIKKISSTEKPFEYKSDYLEHGDFNEILELLKKKYLNGYNYNRRKKDADQNNTLYFFDEHLPLAGAISKNYNKLLKEKQRFVEVKEFSRDYFFDTATKGESEEEKEENLERVQNIIKNPDFTFNHCIYYNEPLLSAMSLYRRLRNDPDKKLTLSQITLFIEAIGLPLRLNLSFPEGSVRDKKYTPIFQDISNVQDQLNCYFCLEHLDFSKWIRTIVPKKGDENPKRFLQIYRRYMENVMYYKDFGEIVEMIGAKIKICFSAETIQKYRVCHENMSKISDSIKQLSLSDELSTKIESKILESIPSGTFDIQFAECLVHLKDEVMSCHTPK